MVKDKIIDMDSFFIESKKFSMELLTELRRPTFMRTKIDVVYSDIVNWEVEGILYESVRKEKGSQKKLSYIEYIWLKMIEEFKAFNFSIDDIKFYKQELFQPYPLDDLCSIIREQMKYSKEGREALKHDDGTKLKEGLSELGLTVFEIALSEIIQNGHGANILCFKTPIDILCVTDGALNDLVSRGCFTEYQDYLKKTHLNISLKPIISKFLREGKIDSSKQMILTSDEYRIITEIRKRIKGIKSVSVHYSNKNVRRIDIQNLKPIKAESSLMAVIKKSDYSKIELVTEKGSIVSLLHTEKIKV